MMQENSTNQQGRDKSKRVVSLKDLWPFLKPYRLQMGIAFVLLCLASATLLLVPLAFRDLIDVGFGHRDDQVPTINIDTKFGVLYGLATFWALMVSSRYYMVSWIGERVTVDLRSAVYASVLRQSPQFFETLQTGEVLSRLTVDTTLIQTVVGSSASMGLRSLLAA
jgi:ATP-binding cassette subfamily B protein